MARTDHLHTRHRGLIPDDQLATGTPSAGRVPVSNGAGSRAWTTPVGLTVKDEDGTPSVANVTEIRVTNGSLTNNGSGSVSVATGGGGGGGGWETVGATGTRLEAGRSDIWDENQDALIFMPGTGIISLAAGTVDPTSFIELAPANDGYVDVVSGIGLLLPVQAADPTAVRDGHIYYDTATDAVRLRANGAWVTLVAGAGYTDEAAQDAVGGILTDSASIDFTYTDATPAITASVIGVPSAAADCSANVDLPANTLTDVTGCSISLTAGTWEIDGWITFTANTSYALLVIADASNNLVAEMRGLPNAAAETTWPVSARVTPGSTTTYKLRAQTDGGTDVLKLGAGNAIGTRIRAIKVV